MIRNCALDSGSLTTDTEIVRMSHCGSFVFEDRRVTGCVQSCFEDACNHATSSKVTQHGIQASTITILMSQCLEMFTHLCLYFLTLFLLCLRL